MALNKSNTRCSKNCTNLYILQLASYLLSKNLKYEALQNFSMVSNDKPSTLEVIIQKYFRLM